MWLSALANSGAREDALVRIHRTGGTTMALTSADLAHRPAATCASSATVEQAARIMAERNVGSVVVVDDDRQPVGIVTDRDLVIRSLAAGDEPGKAVRDVMTHELASVAESSSPLDAARQMALRGCRRLPVVSDDTGRVIGVVAADDLLEGATEQIEAISRCLAPMRRGLVVR
jgi:signal-transduction protein with cAMP-binding, CBS, and nucleotidyltransferase domain